MPTLLLAVILCGCTKKSEPADTVAVDNTQMRIISMAPNLTEILFALGLDDEIVGVTKHSTIPEKAKTKKNVGTFWQPDVEAVLVCRPTLVLTLGFAQQTALAGRLKQIGCRTLTVEIETIDQLYAAIETIGQAVEKVPQSQSLIGKLRSKQSQLATACLKPTRPKVFWVVQRQPLRVAGTKTFANEMIEIAGGVNAIGDTIHQYPTISGEVVIGSMPDVIIEPTMEPGQMQQQKNTAKKFYRRFDMTPAVQNDRIYVIDGDLVSRLSPRLDEALEQIANCIKQEDK